MKKSVFFAVALALSTSLAFADTYVNGYYRSNGTYVAPHYRSDANHTKADNWTTRGNVNPHTGEAGTRTYNNYNNSRGYNNSYGSSHSNSYGNNNQYRNYNRY